MNGLRLVYNIPSIITRVPVCVNPGEFKLQLFYEDVDFELLQAKGWQMSDDNSVCSNSYNIMISCVVVAPFHMPILLQSLLPKRWYKHGSLECSKILAAPPCSPFIRVVNK